MILSVLLHIGVILLLLLLSLVLVVVVTLRNLFVFVRDTGHGWDQLVPFRLFTHSILHCGSLFPIILQEVARSTYETASSCSVLWFYISFCSCNFMNIRRVGWLIMPRPHVFNRIFVQNHTVTGCSSQAQGLVVLLEPTVFSRVVNLLFLSNLLRNKAFKDTISPTGINELTANRIDSRGIWPWSWVETYKTCLCGLVRRPKRPRIESWLPLLSLIYDRFTEQVRFSPARRSTSDTLAIIHAVEFWVISFPSIFLWKHVTRLSTFFFVNSGSLITAITILFLLKGLDWGHKGKFSIITYGK